MAGLVAVVSTDPRAPVGDAALADLARAYEGLRGGVRTETVQEPGVGLVLFASSGAAPFFDRAADAWCAVVGRAHPAPTASACRPEDLDGQFALVSHDGATGETVVSVDRFGMQALYVATRDSRLYVSTSCLALAKCLRAAPDRFALESFLRAGSHFGARTHWQGIERVEPGTRISIGERSTQEVYWRPEVDRDVAAMDLHEASLHCIATAADDFGTKFGGGETPWVDLTGGFDTRLLALLLDHAGIEFVCDTRGATDDADRSIARQIAAAKRWELFDPVMPADWADVVVSRLPGALAWGDGHLHVVELAWVLSVHEQMGRRHPGLLIGGGGEHWRGFAWSQEFLQAGRSRDVNLANWVNMRLLHPMDVGIFARDPTPAIREDFARRMSTWAAPYSDELNTIQLDIMYAYKMTGHFGAYRSADAAHLLAELPFYAKRAFTAAISVDHRHRARHGLMRHAISRLDPTVASIQTSSGGPALPWRLRTAHRFLPYYTRIGRRAVTKLTQTAFGKPLLAPRPRGWWAPTSARRAVIDVLGRDATERRARMRSHGLYDPVVLERFFEASRTGERAGAELLSRIVTVELALREADASLD